ncbi:unnamed protein product [Cochlearia groenlandica]
MAPNRKKGGRKSAAATSARREWKVGDLVLAKVKGFPAWPAAVTKPEEWGYSADWKKVLVHFFGTKQIAFCSHADVELFTEEKKQSLLTKRHAKGSDFVRAVKEITESYEIMKKQDQATNPKSAEETTGGSSGIATQLPQACENLVGTGLNTQTDSNSSNGKDESTLLSEDASAAEQMLALRHNSVTLNGARDSSEAKDVCELATYSSRRRNEGARSQNCAAQKTILPPQHSKTSSRLQRPMLQCSDDGQSVDGVVNGVAKRRKRIRRSGYSESDDVVSPALTLHGSDEGKAPETATVECDNISRNEASGVVSGSKVEYSDTGVEGCDGGHELNRGFDFQISTLVKRKKRKPARKRETSDPIDPPAKVEAEGLGTSACDSCQGSLNSHESFNERPCEENGDEHLPLVKRARVRMSRAFYVDEKVNSSSQFGESLSKDIPMSGAVQTSPSLNHDNDIVSCQDTSAAEEYNSSELSVKLPSDMVDVVPFYVEKPSDSVFPSKDTLISGAVQASPSLNHENDIGACHGTSAAEELNRSELSAKLPSDMVDVVPFDVEKPSDRLSPSKDTLISGTEQTSPLLNHENGISACHDTSAAEKLNSTEFSAPSDLVNVDPLSMMPDGEVTRAQTNQLGGSPEGKTRSSEVVQGCSDESQTRDSESDPIDLQCSRESEKTETPPNLDNVDSSPNKPSSLCLGLDMTASGVPAQSPHKLHQSHENDFFDHSLVVIGDSSLHENSEKIDNMAQLAQSQAEEHSQLFSSVVDSQEVENMTENNLLGKKQGSPGKELAKKIQATSSVSASENLSRENMSFSPANVADSPARGTPHSDSVCHISTAESATVVQNNSNCSTSVQFGEKKIMSDDTVKESIVETGVTQVEKVVSSGVQFIIESFETALGSLVRTKETIGRATRLAMNLVKYGASAKAMEILAHTLECESNLERRVDLFFLVDSIAQCSKGPNGDAGGVYLSSIQAMLPRLLAAAVPAGATTQENRRQCLKVLRLWLERRILPESIIRHHIKELDSYSNVPVCLYSRRSARTERALDDPVRDMEDMLVDEYGSNSALQLNGFCMPAMLKDEDGGSDSDEDDFESVTPEHESRTLEEHVAPSITERHTRILEDVDGELEMEDVAPPWEVGSGAIANQAENTESANCQPVSGASHKNVTSSSPPVPPSQDAKCAMPDSYSNGFDCNGYPTMHGDHQFGPPKMNPPMHYRSPESSYSSRVTRGEGSNFQHRPYPSSHPPPPPSHHYSYMEPDHHIKSRREGPSYPHRSHYTPDFEERMYHEGHERMRHAPCENRDNWRHHPPSSHGPRYHERHKGPYQSTSYSGHHRDSGRFQNQRWSHSPRAYNNRHSFHHKPDSEGPVPVGMRDPATWHER